jgi:hypothetical protein
VSSAVSGGSRSRPALATGAVLVVAGVTLAGVAGGLALFVVALAQAFGYQALGLIPLAAAAAVAVGLSRTSSGGGAPDSSRTPDSELPA